MNVESGHVIINIAYLLPGNSRIVERSELGGVESELVLYAVDHEAQGIR